MIGGEKVSGDRGEAVEKTISTFDKYAKAYEERFMNHTPYVQTYARLSDLLPAEASVLDVACGPGNIARYLLEKAPGRTISGIDLSARMVELAALNNPRANFEVMDCRSISTFEEAGFDGIVAGFCLPYLSREEVKQWVVDARRLLRMGGILYVSLMEGDHASSGLKSKNGVDWVCTYFYEAEYLVELLAGVGFDVIEIERKPFEREGEPTVTDIFIYARAV